MNSYQLMIDSLQVRFLHIKSYALDYHWHAAKRTLHHSVLWYVEQGSFYLTLDEISYTCQEGQLCVLPANGEISYRAISDELRIISINFDAEISFLSDRSWEHVLNIPVIFEAGAAELQPLVGEMLDHSGVASPFLSLFMQSSLLRILYVVLQQSMADPVAASFQRMDERIHTIIHYLLAHPDQMPEVAQLADLVSLSESHLRKLFIQYTGQAPLHFIHRLKIEQAKKLLAASTKTISQISYELGVHHANYFTRLFKAKTGFTPQQYRQQFGMWLNE
ncbi:AraC family transcriptional regulator [Paenibacillus agricola]|uniref:AraC family transcriptional regulator n=1 Tax=Paenibacillus agricola TaxID=2716264 RepID=A0ABX0J5S9_9BACL|nr:AraC family transcriptional regulator [Paenibacillus agricola]NHN30514.1 AraC family transcriptional regulator [Paenibacillus agricola]